MVLFGFVMQGYVFCLFFLPSLCEEDKQRSFVSALFNFRAITQMLMYACKEFTCC